jgi:hypothetical protein
VKRVAKLRDKMNRYERADTILATKFKKALQKKKPNLVSNESDPAQSRLFWQPEI